MNEMTITSAQYTLDREGNASGINVVIEGVAMSVPLSSGNRHYAEILRQVEAGTLVIADAE